MNFNLNKKKLIVSSLLIIISVIFFGQDKIKLTKIESVQAAHPISAPANVSGWAWSETLGWISFNSTNCDSDDNGKVDDPAPLGCPEPGSKISQYGVFINKDSGEISGYAWSFMAGWISFNESDLSNCPKGPCSASVDQTVTPYQMKGWAKILFKNASDDGWIALNCSNVLDPAQPGNNICSTSNFKVSIDPDDGKISGYATGGETFGWISFSGIVAGSNPVQNYQVTTTAFKLIEKPVYDTNVFGFAWANTPQSTDGDQGVGWISFNSKNCDSDDDRKVDVTPLNGCPKAGSKISQYGVFINKETGKMNGHAWSESIGWISFNESDLSNCPGGPCNASVNIIDPKTKEMVGWAKALSMKNPDADGWIALNCLNGSSTGGNICDKKDSEGKLKDFKVTIDTGTTDSGTNVSQISGYAWGGNVLGWIKFNGSGYGVTTTAFPYIAPVVPPVGAIITIIPGQSVGGSGPVFSSTLQSIKVTPENPSIAVGTVQIFTATGTFNANSTELELEASVLWSSSVESVASIDSNGVATALMAGTTIITATSGSVISESAILTVNPKVVILPPVGTVIPSPTETTTTTTTTIDYWKEIAP